ncbi:hypothetical protein EVAR_48796_1 [Eumeta japonica]|uniref:Secreted protein n=1 Tax=Eumeta variegata TaxID=151549 RepID=A0A4C1SP61_EUMVA|nr:hypothetical protein EVAR_48796_1 [Eumeta japonica]
MKPVLVLTCSLLFVLCRHVLCGRIPSGSDLTRTILLQEDRRCEETEISKREVSAIGTKFPVGVKKRSVQRRSAPKIGAGGVLACPPGWISGFDPHHGRIDRKVNLHQTVALVSKNALSRRPRVVAAFGDGGRPPR